MRQLEQFYRQLVDSMIALDPARLHRPFEVGEIASTILPYRLNRRALGTDTVEDYDQLVLQLAAGEGGYVRTDPPEAQARFLEELRGPSPDLAILTTLASTRLVLNTEQLAYALGPDPETAFAPPEENTTGVDPDPSSEVRWTPATGGTPGGGRFFLEEPGSPGVAAERPNRCQFCGGTLPPGRTVNFCPQCGQSQSFTRCPECASEIELGWRHCITCGVALDLA